MNDETDLGNLWGADAIGRTIGKTAKSTYHMLESGRLPARKIGGLWVVRRVDLEKHFTAQVETPLDAAAG